MKIFLFLLLIFIPILIIGQENSLDKIPEYKLSFEAYGRNENNGEWGNITYNDSVPQLMYETNHNGRPILVAFFNKKNLLDSETNHIVTYMNFADTWQKMHQSEIDLGLIRNKLKFYTIDELEYVYFEYISTPGASNTFNYYYFCVYDIINNKVYELECEGEMDFQKEFIRFKNVSFNYNNLLERPNILGTLEKEAANSNRIIR